MKVTFAGAVKSAFVNFAQFRGVSYQGSVLVLCSFHRFDEPYVLGTIDSVILAPGCY
jgi:hypothetical protein